MKALIKAVGLFSLLSALILTQGCATLFGGRTNSMVFTGDPGSTAEIYIDDNLVGEAPGKIVIPKQEIQHGSVLEIRTEGKPTKEYLILRKPHAGYILADFIVGGIPLIFDTATGNILRPSPRKFDISLDKPE